MAQNATYADELCFQALAHTLGLVPNTNRCSSALSLPGSGCGRDLPCGRSMASAHGCGSSVSPIHDGSSHVAAGEAPPPAPHPKATPPASDLALDPGVRPPCLMGHTAGFRDVASTMYWSSKCGRGHRVLSRWLDHFNNSSLGRGMQTLLA